MASVIMTMHKKIFDFHPEKKQIIVSVFTMYDQYLQNIFFTFANTEPLKSLISDYRRTGLSLNKFTNMYLSFILA